MDRRPRDQKGKRRPSLGNRADTSSRARSLQSLGRSSSPRQQTSRSARSASSPYRSRTSRNVSTSERTFSQGSKNTPRNTSRSRNNISFQDEIRQQSRRRSAGPASAHRNVRRTSLGSARDHDESYRFTQERNTRDKEDRRTHRRSNEQRASSQAVPLGDSTSKFAFSSGQPSSKRGAGTVLKNIWAWLWAKSKVASFAVILALVLIVAGGVDSLANLNRIYPGVSVGNIDLSGKTIDEATELIAQEYEGRFLSNSAILCSTEEVAQKAESGFRNDSIEEQISYEESLRQRSRWTLDAQHLQASFDPNSLALKAYQVGRDDGWIFARIQASMSNIDITPSCTFSPTVMDDLRDEIIASLGSKMVNFNIEMHGLEAWVTDGHDGYEVSYDWLYDTLNEALLFKEGESRYVIDMHDVPIQIDHDAAENCSHMVEASIGQGVNFEFQGTSYYADPDQLSSWVTTEVVQDGAIYVLKPRFNKDVAFSAIINGFGFHFDGSDYVINFSNDNGSITVQTNAKGSVPYVSRALEDANNSFFTTTVKESAPTISVASHDVPSTMNFDEALDYGLITEIRSFTTKYASGAEARNNNIHVAADALNNSICKAGETWSFLALSGEATEDKGYQGAHAIIGGELSDAIGGGICQVATTVYNAVYEAGYPIEMRYNHSLYVASYPEGRDAAIAYPDMDLIWLNDTDSDVLLVMSYTNSSVTAKLYGVDPGYSVETITGEWQEGEPFKTIYRQDPDIAQGKEVIESNGLDGRYITIKRIVKDKDGNVIREKEFHSNYSPQNKVVVQGTKPSPSSEE